MTSFNEKNGMRRPGKRSFMKLPPTLAERARLTSAICPECQRTGARLKPSRPGWVFCSWCNHTWELPVE